MKRILICGSNGLVGQNLALMLSENTEYEVLNTSLSRSFVFDKKLFDYNQLDLTHRGDVKSLISSFRPDVIFNAAAAAQPDWCELNREAAWKINVNAVEYLVEACRKIDAYLIHVSTDYIFDGKLNKEYTENDKPNPINYYGKTKLAAENAIVTGNCRASIIRTSLIYGFAEEKSQNFIFRVINSLRHSNEALCPEDQICRPTYVKDIARAMIDCFLLRAEGIFNVGGSIMSRYDLAMLVAKVFKFDENLVKKIKLSSLDYMAVRPAVVILDTHKAQSLLNFKPTDPAHALLCMKHNMETGTLN